MCIIVFYFFLHFLYLSCVDCRGGPAQRPGGDLAVSISLVGAIKGPVEFPKDILSIMGMVYTNYLW